MWSVRQISPIQCQMTRPHQNSPDEREEHQVLVESCHEWLLLAHLYPLLQLSGCLLDVDHANQPPNTWTLEMSQVLRSPVPSNTLLRFLRAQSQDLPSIYQRCGPLQCPPKVATQACCASNLATRQRAAPQTLATPAGPVLSRGCCPLRRRSTLSAKTGSAFFTTSARRTNGYYDGQNAQGERQLTWQERLWGMAARRGSKPLNPDDLPGREDDMFSPRRTMSAKAALEPRVRCTEVDENGETTITDGEFKKTELIAKVSPAPPG